MKRSAWVRTRRDWRKAEAAMHRKLKQHEQPDESPVDGEGSGLLLQELDHAFGMLTRFRVAGDQRYRLALRESHQCLSSLPLWSLLD